MTQDKKVGVVRCRGPVNQTTKHWNGLVVKTTNNNILATTEGKYENISQHNFRHHFSKGRVYETFFA